MVSPGSFIPVGEESGLIRPIGMWVAAQAAQALAKWRAMGFDIYCSVNVSGRQMDEEGFADESDAGDDRELDPDTTIPLGGDRARQ